jgi:hypothetical protein
LRVPLPLDFLISWFACWFVGLRPPFFQRNLRPVFQLTQREKQVVAFVLLAFLIGWGFQQVRKWQAFSEPQPPTSAEAPSAIHEFQHQLPRESRTTD